MQNLFWSQSAISSIVSVNYTFWCYMNFQRIAVQELFLAIIALEQIFCSTYTISMLLQIKSCVEPFLAFITLVRLETSALWGCMFFKLLSAMILFPTKITQKHFQYTAFCRFKFWKRLLEWKLVTAILQTKVFTELHFVSMCWIR